MVIGNSFFKKKEINKYTWIRVANGRVIERTLMGYVLVTKRMVGRLKDVHVFRGLAAGMSDHFLVEAEVVVAKEWGNRVVGCRREVMKVEELKQVKPISFEAPQGGAYNNRKHLKLETPRS